MIVNTIDGAGRRHRSRRYALLVAAQVFVQAGVENRRISLANEKFRRMLRIDEANHAFFTTSFNNDLSGVDLCLPGSEEFAFYADDHLVTGGASSRREAGVFDGRALQDGLRGCLP